MDARGVREGMAVYSADGERLGKVVAIGDGGFVVEKGLFFPRDYLVRLDEVSRIDGDDLHVTLPKQVMLDRIKGDRGFEDTATPSARSDRVASQGEVGPERPVVREEADIEEEEAEDESGRPLPPSDPLHP